MAKLDPTRDFPIVAIGHNVYRRTQSSPLCTCVDMDLAIEIAVRLNKSEGINDRKRAYGQHDDFYNGNHGL